MSDQFIRSNKRQSLASRVAKLQSEVKELWADCEQLKRERDEAIKRAEKAEKELGKAKKINQETVSILADAHDEDSGCGFTLDIDDEDSDVGCFACLAQIKLAELS